MSPPDNEVTEIERLSHDERQTALRALLRRPLLLANHPEHRLDFAKVRRHTEPLRAWFSRHAGWTLDVTTECARLYKIPARLSDDTRPAFSWRAGKQVPFTRIQYVLLCLALATLVRGENQTSLGELAKSIDSAWKDDPAFAQLTFDLETTNSRRDLLAAIHLLLDLHVLTQVDGDDQHFVHDRAHEALYDVRHHILYRLLSTRRPPSTITDTDWNTRIAALVSEPVIDEEEQRNQRIRHFITRRLLDDPVLYPEGDLPRDAQEYFLKQRPHILQALADATDLEPEDRRDGVALSDKTGDCTDVGLPEAGTDGHATLLTAEYLGKLRLESPGDIIPLALIEKFLSEQVAAHKDYWRQEFTQPGAEQNLARSVIERLASLDLVRALPEGLLVLPAIHRYRHELREKQDTSDTTTP